MSLRRGSLRPDRGNAGGAEGQIHGSPQQHRNISARSRMSGQGREVRAEAKQTTRCWVHMAEMCSTKTANYCWILRKTTSLLCLLNTLFCTPKSGVSHTFQSANRSKGQERLYYILTKQADRRLIRCVNVDRPPLEVP